MLLNTFATKKGPLRYFLKLAYNGSDFHGWQIQPNAPSVQEFLSEKLSIILRKEINVVGAGRTDTGVHAKVMFAHFDLEYTLKDKAALLNSLNKMLSPAVYVSEMLLVRDDAHARFDALNRAYEYWVNRERDPFSDGLAANILYPLDLNLMNEAAAKLCYKGDFSSFSKSKTQTKTNICEIRKAYWEDRGNQWVFHIEADRFLRNMVRAIVGSLIEVGKAKMSLKDFEEMVEAKDRSLAGESVPAKGLYLTKVDYPPQIFLDER